MPRTRLEAHRTITFPSTAATTYTHLLFLCVVGLCEMWSHPFLLVDLP